MAQVTVKLNKQEVSYYNAAAGLNMFLDRPVAKIDLAKQNEYGIKALKRAVESGVLELVEGSFPVDDKKEQKETKE